MYTQTTCYKLLDKAIKGLIENQLKETLKKLERTIPPSGKIELITQDELIRRLSISKATLWRHRKKGMPHERVGKKVYYNFNDVLKYWEN